MFSFFKKKKPEAETPAAVEPAVPATPAADVAPVAPPAAPAEQPGFLRRLFGAGDETPPVPPASRNGHSKAHAARLARVGPDQEEEN